MGAACCKIALRSPPDSLQGFAYSQHTTVDCWGGGLHKYQGFAGDGCQRPLVPRSRASPRLKPSVRRQRRKEKNDKSSAKVLTLKTWGGSSYDWVVQPRHLIGGR